MEVTKAPLPVLWADSSIEMKLAKVAAGEALLPDEIDRLKRLASIIDQKVSSGRLACPIGDQDEEVQIGRRLVVESRELPVFGHERPAFKRRDDLQFVQLVRAIDAGVHRRAVVSCHWTDGFVSRSDRRRLSLLTPILLRREDAAAADIEHVLATRERNRQNLESLRQRNRASGRTLEEQIAHEDQVLENLKAASGQVSNPPPGSSPEAEAVKPFPIEERLSRAWISAARRPPLPHEIPAFVRSAYYRSMPYHYINSRLHAELLTSDRPIRPGDSMDVQQLSAVIPYASIVITDGDMCDRLGRLGIGSTFKTSIHSARKRDFDRLFDELSAL
jgi:hypothetical protein